MDKLELLLFTLGGVAIGVDTEQVAGIITLEQAEERGMEPAPLHRMMPFGGRPVTYREPRALLTKGDPPRAVVIEAPEDILATGIDAVHPLPETLAACSAATGIWGATVRKDGIVLLVDLDKLDKALTRRGESGQNIPTIRQEAVL